MNNVSAMSLPAIGGEKENKNYKYSSKSEKCRIDVNVFKTKAEKVVEIKIYLNQNFHKNNIDDVFLADLDQQYARQYLERIGTLATKDNIKKILKYKPVDKCDFSLTVETIRQKSIKLLHIYPNPKGNQPHNTLKSVLSNEDFEKVMNKNFGQGKEGSEDKLTQIKKREVKREELAFYVPELVDNLFNKAKEEIQDKKLYLQSHGLIEQHGKVFDLNIDAIREKYIKPNSQIMLDNKEISQMNSKAKFQNIDKVVKVDIYNDEKFAYPFLDIDLTHDILKEINKPIEVPVEVIMKDINFILDNFPIDQLINLDEPLKKIDPLTLEENFINKANTAGAASGSGSKLKHENYFGNFKPKKQNFYFKVKTVSKNDLLYVYKKIQSPPIYRMIGILVNLLYWIIFGFTNRIQIDKLTKRHMFFKILEELHSFELTFGNKKTFDKLFMPIFILIVRIECEAIFHKKFKSLYEEKTSADKAVQKINEIITIIFDPNCYFNTFTILSSDMTKMKHKVSKNLYPNYKAKVNATSNLVNQIFSKFHNKSNVKFMKGQMEEKAPLMLNDEEWELERKYINECKGEFYKVLLSKINQNLMKRNLDPIFEVSREKQEKETATHFIKNMNAS